MLKRFLTASLAVGLSLGASRAESQRPAPSKAAADPNFAEPARPVAAVSVVPPAALPVATSPAPVAPVAAAGCDRLQRLCCEPCGPVQSGWFRADYLLWFQKSGGLPPLAVGDVPGTARAAVGLPTTPGQRVLFGNQGANGDVRSGLRIEGGLWLDECNRIGVSGDYFFLEGGGDGGRFFSPGDPPLTRPFFNTRTGRPDAELVSFPNVLAGSVDVRTATNFSGAGAFARLNLCCGNWGPCGDGYRVDLLAGYRHYSFNDEVRITEDLLATGMGLVAPGTRIVVRDRFRTENTFHGGLLGLTGEVRRGSWYADFRGGVALGNLRRELTVEGSTTVSAAGQGTIVRPGGLLAQRSNIGRFTSDTFTAAPELGLNLGYRLTPGIGVHVGYSFIYLPNVWRAGDQIDTGVDSIQLQGGVGARPVPRLASTGFWVQGVNLGMIVRY